MIIVKKSTMSVIDSHQLRRENPNVSFPAVLTNAALEGTDYQIIDNPDQAEIGRFKTAVVGVPYTQGGKIKVDFVVTEKVPPMHEILQEFEAAIDRHLDAKAKEYRYDSVYTMISYKGDPNPKFDREARSMFMWRSAVWTKANEILASYIANPDLKPNEIPNVAYVLSQLPEFDLLPE
jgi:hypothetical protein